MCFVKVSHLIGNSGNEIKNQFVIRTKTGKYFQSYNSIIAFVPSNGDKVQLDSRYWDYSVTTGKYRNIFLGEDIKETRRKITEGIYELTNLN
jgi:hypothetical protein